MQLGGVLFTNSTVDLIQSQKTIIWQAWMEILHPILFGNTSSMNPNKYDEKQFFQILNHEKIHVQRWHTLDLILAELLILFQWFNPFAWLHRYLITENLEYQVDDAVLSKGEDKKAYQYHLLQVAIPNYPLSITTNYNQSLIKKRITMMNRKRSSLSVILKYLLLLPLAFILLLAFQNGPAEFDIDETNAVDKTVKADFDRIYILITDRATNRELRALQEELDQYGLSIQFDKLIYKDGSIIEADATFYVNGGSRANYNFTTDEEKDWREILFFKVEKDIKTSIGAGFNEETLINMQDENVNIKIFTAGLEKSQNIISYLTTRKEIEEAKIKDLRRQRAQDPDWKGEKSNWTFSIADINDAKLSLVQKSIKKADGIVRYFVDGIEWEAEEALNLDHSIMDQISVYHEQYKKKDENGEILSKGPLNVDIKILRKPGVTATDKVQNIYVVISSKTKEKELTNMQKDLKKNGLELTFDQLEFNNDGKVTKISVSVIDHIGIKGVNSHTYSITHSFKKKPQSKVYIYRVGGENIDKIEDAFGVGKFDDPNVIKNIPENVRSAFRGINHGYLIGNWSK